MVSPNSKLKSLNPFLDENRVLAIGGQLGSSELSFLKKHPAIFPKSHKMSVIVMSHYHKKHLHVGASILHVLLRVKLWSINGRAVCRKVVTSQEHNLF